MFRVAPDIILVKKKNKKFCKSHSLIQMKKKLERKIRAGGCGV
jgi:hypothetical protein